LSRPENAERSNEQKQVYTTEGTPNQPDKIQELLSDDNDDLPF
jgi:hypothetical protein